MAIQGEYTIEAPREAVWRALNDPAVLQACIPGCDSLSMSSDSEIDAKITAQIGPIRSSFATHIVLSDSDPPSGYTLSAEGKGVAGFGRGTAKVSLADMGGRTVLTYDAQITIGGKLAQVGSRLVESATRSYSDQFFEAFARQFTASVGTAPSAGPDRRRCDRWRQIRCVAHATLVARCRGNRRRRFRAVGRMAIGVSNMRISVSCVVNGAPVGAEVEPRTLLVDFLRNQLHLTGTHVGCDTSQCGACVVHVDGRAIKSCSMLAAQAEGAEITTIEGLAAKSGAIGRTDLHPMQAAFRAEHGLQCGFCTAGHDHDRGRTRDPRSEPERSGRARWAGGQLLPLYGLSQHREGSSQGGGPTCVRPAAARGEAAPAGAESSHV